MTHEESRDTLALLSDDELIDLIWKEKRDKVLGKPLPQALVIYIPSPIFDIQELARGILEAMQSIPHDEAYKWSQNWGKTSVVLGFSDIEYAFLDEKSGEAKKTVKLHSLMPMNPESRLNVLPEGRKYFIILNNEPSPVEGIVLQTERMVDELVWCLSLRYKALVHDPVEAYAMALQELSREGFDIHLLNKKQILDLRRSNEAYQVRIYGNFNNRGKVPQVIGAVGPFEEHSRPASVSCSTQTTDLDIQPKSEKLSLPEKPFLNMGICVAKRPHVGHMLLASVVEIARRSIGDSVPIIIHANDTGPRIIQTVARAAQERDTAESGILDLIAKGQIDSSELEHYYRTRIRAGKQGLVQAEQAILRRKNIMPVQAREHGKVFDSFWENSEASTVILESNVDLKYGPQDVLNSSQWYGTGMSFVVLNGRRYILESNGLLSASATRSTTMNFAAQEINRGVPIYIDEDQSITDSLDLLAEQVGLRGIQYPGAAIGFGMNISSGTGGDSVYMDDFIESYRVTNPDRSLVERVVYLISTRYQLKPKNGASFFDYSHNGAFLRDIESLEEERVVLKLKARHVLQKLWALINHNATEVRYGNNSKKAKKIKHVVERLLDTNEVEDECDPHKIFLEPRVMRETPKVQRLIDRAISSKGISRDEATLQVLISIAIGQTEATSNIITELIKHGYEDGSLVKAVSRFVQDNYSFVRINSLLFHTMESIEEVVEHILEFDKSTGTLLIQRYRSAFNRLFNENL